MQTFCVFIRDGQWHSGYHCNDLQDAYVGTRYKLEPLEGESIPSNGEYRGIIPTDGVLRLVSGGEYAYGMMMNQQLRDYKVTFDDIYHDEYKAGVARAVNGKRKLQWRHCVGKSDAWMYGYRSGQAHKQAMVAA